MYRLYVNGIHNEHHYSELAREFFADDEYEVIPINIENAENLGYLPKNIIAMQGPFSKNMNVAMLENFKIDYLITKESGETGGALEKLEACQECKVGILAIKRPVLDYGIVFNTISELVNYVKNLSV